MTTEYDFLDAPEIPHDHRATEFSVVWLVVVLAVLALVPWGAYVVTHWLAGFA